MTILFILGFVWALPVMLVGVVLLPFYGSVAFRWEKGVLLVQVKRVIGFKTTAGQTFSVIIFLKPPLDTVSQRLVLHERAHTQQAFRLGPLFLLAYPFACLVAMAHGGHFYRDNYFEIQARNAEVVE